MRTSLFAAVLLMLHGIARSDTPGSDDTLCPRLTNSVQMELVCVPAGELLMGASDSDEIARADEKPQHRVQIVAPLMLPFDR